MVDGNGNGDKNVKTERFGLARIIFPLVLIFIILSVNVTFAWFSSYWDSEGTKARFTTGGVLYPTIHMWTFTTKEEGSSLDSGEWEEKTVTTTDGVSEIPSAISENFNVKDVHLGTIDNLVTQKTDNSFYLRFDATKEIGATFSLTVQYAGAEDTGYNFSIYSMGRTDTYSYLDPTATENVTVYESLKSIVSDEDNPITEITFAVSENAYSPSSTDFGSLEFVETCPDAPDADSYYFYVRITPKLATVAKISQDLYSYMPCIILFDLDMHYEIYTA